MKYIDAEKLIAGIERYKKGAAIARFDNAGENADYFQGKVDMCADLTHIITSLQQEQPQGLDEAAEEATKKAYPDDAYYGGRSSQRLFKEGFKAGAEWMAEQLNK